MKLRKYLIGITAFFSLQIAYADIVVPMYLVETGKENVSLGAVTFSQQKCGVLITPNLHDLSPGVHGFHIHEKPSCADNAMAAGGHLDPQTTKAHNGPYQEGHLGDLPVLIVKSDGTATLPTLAPRLTLDDLKDHALMIHVGSDNYSDQPDKLGGGGARMACGVIK